MGQNSKEEKRTFNIVIETPKGSRNKYSFSKKLSAFTLKKILPAGAVFPFDFGYIPDTKAEDGDPLDVLVIMDEPAFPGCLVQCRVIGALIAKQSEGDKMVRNDRLIAVSVQSRLYSHLETIEDLDENVRNEIEHFFVSYNDSEGKKFKPKGWTSSRDAEKIIRRSGKF